jgi:hypothetical protein
MCIPTRSHLTERGFAHHFILPVLAVLAVGGIGTLYLALTHAATVVPYTGAIVAYKGPCTGNTYTTADANTREECVKYAQILMNGIQHQGNKLGLASVGGGTFGYEGQNYVYMDGYYGTGTADAVNAVSKSKTLNTASWYDICDAAVDSGLTSQSNSASSGILNFASKATGVASGESGNLASPSSNRTIFLDSCGNATSGGSTATTWALTATTAAPSGVTSIKAGNSVTFTSTIKNTGSSATGSFSYSLHDFY